VAEVPSVTLVGDRTHVKPAGPPMTSESVIVPT